MRNPHIPNSRTYRGFLMLSFIANEHTNAISQKKISIDVVNEIWLSFFLFPQRTSIYQIRGTNKFNANNATNIPCAKLKDVSAKRYSISGIII